jgi:putative transposase
VTITEGKPRRGWDMALSPSHLDDLRSRLRRYKKVHVIRDRAKCHTSEAVAV